MRINESAVYTLSSNFEQKCPTLHLPCIALPVCNKPRSAIASQNQAGVPILHQGHPDLQHSQNCKRHPDPSDQNTFPGNISELCVLTLMFAIAAYMSQVLPKQVSKEVASRYPINVFLTYSKSGVMESRLESLPPNCTPAMLGTMLQTGLHNLGDVSPFGVRMLVSSCDYYPCCIALAACEPAGRLAQGCHRVSDPYLHPCYAGHHAADWTAQSGRCVALWGPHAGKALWLSHLLHCIGCL